MIPPVVQTLWDIPHAVWFALMGVGGGIFLLARLLRLEMRLGIWLGLPLVDLLSFAVISIGGLILIQHLGRPFRFLRALARPGASWIARGAIADFIFMVAGGLLVLPGLTVGGATPFAGLPWDAAGGGAAGGVLEWLALLSSAVVIFYAGQVLADATAIPYWRSPAIPIQFVLSSLATSMGIVMLMQTLAAQPIGALEFGLLLLFLVLLLAVILAHLGTNTTAPGKAESLALLRQGRFRRGFLWGVVGTGTVLPIAVAVVGLALPRARDAAGLVALVATLPAGFYLRLYTLRAGLLLPVRLRLTPPSMRRISG